MADLKVAKGVTEVTLSLNAEEAEHLIEVLESYGGDAFCAPATEEFVEEMLIALNAAGLNGGDGT